MRKPEILAPAGSLEKLKTAIDFGADAVYIGGSKLNLRAFADNFTNEQIAEGVKYAHDRGRKVYVTMNVVLQSKPCYFPCKSLSYGSDGGMDWYVCGLGCSKYNLYDSL